MENITTRYAILWGHFGMEPTHNKTDVAHKNGTIWISHSHIRKCIEDKVASRGVLKFWVA